MSGTVKLQDGGFKYRAFLSYSHADTKWAKWLHTGLEGFRIDKDLAGRETAAGKIPASLRPIFRDRDEFTAGHTLNEQTIAALDGSAALIVLCSPKSAESHYVNEEIRLFKQRHPDRPIIPVIVAMNLGSAPPRSPKGSDPSQERVRSTPNVHVRGLTPDHDARGLTPAAPSFPPALTFKLGRQGQITGTPEPDILAADVRDDGDGRDLALAKVIARLLGLGTDDVFRRAERERRRQGRVRMSIAATMALLLAGGGYLYWVSQKKGVTIAEQQTTLREIEAIVVKYNPAGSAEVAGPGKKEALTKAVAAIAAGVTTDTRYAKALELLKAGKPAEAEPLLKAVAEEKSAKVQQDKKDTAAAFRNLGAIAGLGDPKKARDAYAKALEFDGDDADSLYWHGKLSFEAGNLAMAEQSLTHLLEIATNTKNARGMFRAHLQLGFLMKDKGNPDAARDHEQSAVDIAARESGAAPSDVIWKQDLAIGYTGLGDVLIAQKQLPDALTALRQSFTVIDQLSKANPSNDGWQRILSVTYNKIGYVLLGQNQLSDALQSVRNGLDIASRLAKASPENAGWRRDLSISYEKVGDVLAAQGNLTEALKMYRDRLDIASGLAKADPSNAGLQRDLAFAYWRLANHGDNPKENWTRVVEILRDMTSKSTLSPADQKFLPIAEENLAKAK